MGPLGRTQDSIPSGRTSTTKVSNLPATVGLLKDHGVQVLSVEMLQMIPVEEGQHAARGPSRSGAQELARAELLSYVPDDNDRQATRVVEDL